MKQLFEHAAMAQRAVLAQDSQIAPSDAAHAGGPAPSMRGVPLKAHWVSVPMGGVRPLRAGADGALRQVLPSGAPAIICATARHQVDVLWHSVGRCHRSASS